MVETPVDQKNPEVPSENIPLSPEERLEVPVKRLIAELQAATPSKNAASLGGLVKRYETQLAQFHKHFQQISVNSLSISYASEWVLDNYYVLRQSIQQIREDLSAGFLKRLPKIDQPHLLGYPRVYFIARAYLEAQAYQVDGQRLEDFLRRIQEEVALTMGELWALPIFLRFVLIEAMVAALHQTVKIDAGQPPTILPARPEISADEVIASGVVSLRTVSNVVWKDFFEHVNLVDQVLRQDPAGIYSRMDFATRDQYRKAVEEIGQQSEMPETEIARAALLIARQSSDQTIPVESYLFRLQRDRRKQHVGYYLIDEGRTGLESAIGVIPGQAQRVSRWLKRRPATPYLGGIFIITAIILAAMTGVLLSLDALFWQMALGWVLTIIPALTIATDLVNRLVTMLVRPSRLPKLDLEQEIPSDLHTLVIVPSLLSSTSEVESLAQQLEQHFLRNTSPGLHFALLSDFPDSKNETEDEDEALIALAIQNIGRLNDRYVRSDGDRPFLLLHRRRVWNESEGKWIGWERKRGKLHELNKLMLGENNLTFSHVAGDLDWLQTARYVITLDADTILPLDAANRLIGTLAHPLNQALFPTNSTQILSGYTILQPRVEISPRSANRSWFTRIFSGDIGLDLYSRAVSDVYQDISGEGSYVGKGIYDVQAFELSTAGHIPENRLLSHDLFEGLLGRAGLVTDITMIEDYPPNYFASARRQHRWIRGDWQLLPWLLKPGTAGKQLSTLDRWKMFDNLRRSLLAPTLLALFLAGWLFLPSPVALWMGLGVLTLGATLLIEMVLAVLRLIKGHSLRAVVQPLWFDFLRRLLALIFLPFEAIYTLGAIVMTLYRLLISRKNLLQWTTAADTALQFKGRKLGNIALQEMGEMVLVVAIIAGLVALLDPERFWTALYLLLPWLLSPLVAAQINRRVLRRVEKLSADQIQRLRSYAHRTWSFYEQFVGPEDHWLPPDHFQEEPLGIVAHRTSPTNIGMLLTSTLAAYELGYIDHLTLVSRLSATLDTLAVLPRYRGHVINWIDTRSLQPLTPRYVSTVDSGNLAACLVITAQSAQGMEQSRIFRWQRWQGFLDILTFLEETLAEVQKIEGDRQLRELMRLLVDTHTSILEVRGHSERWYELFVKISGPLWLDVTQRLAAFVASSEERLNAESLQRILHSSRQVDQHLRGIERTIRELVPWIPLLEAPPPVLSEDSFAGEMSELRANLPYSPVVREIRAHVEASLPIIESMTEKLNSRAENGAKATAALEWLADLSQRLEQAAGRASLLLATFTRIAFESRRFVSEMDFRFLYNQRRRVFHIGYNLDAAHLDDNYYDLMASEARLTSLLAIAKGDVPTEHWLHLNRPITRVNGTRVLLSWSATLFEYIMPTLFLQSYPDTLLDESAEGAVNWQIDYGREKGLPWGVSESGFYRFDANLNYQYRAFGVPGLGFKRGLSDDLVVAPYASLMSVKFAPKEVLQNAARLDDLGMLGLYGFYEAIDFTEKRLPPGMEFGMVRSYMAHHQGMILMGLLNYLKDNVMVERMHADPQIRAVDLLLQEQIPVSAPLQNPESEDVHGTQRLDPPVVEAKPWAVPTITSIPQTQLLSNGSFHGTITNSSSGYLSWQDTDLTRWHPDGVTDQMGLWIYGQFFDGDGREPRLWSIGKQPIPAQDEDFLVTYHGHMAVYRRAIDSITATMEVTIAVDDPLEVRRVHLHNPTDHTRRMRLTSYGEVILTSLANDARHPAFNKLFIQSEYAADFNLLIFRRRPRSSGETPIFLGHMLVTADHLPVTGLYETDRAQFLGRGGDTSRPARLLEPHARRGSTGSTLDPIFSISQNITLAPHESRYLAWLTFAANSCEDLLAIAARYQDWQVIERTFPQAHRIAENRMRRAEISSETVSYYLQLLSALRYPLPGLRSDPEIIAANRLGQSGLWPFGISGDFPILLVRINDPQRLELVNEVLKAHRYWREHGVKVDVVILNEQSTDYGAEMNRMLYRVITRSQSDIWINQRGGVFIVYADQMNEAERILLKTAARVVLNGELGELSQQMPSYTVPVRHLPAFTPSRSAVREEQRTSPLPAAGKLRFFNGYGGFSDDGREYVIELPPGTHTPLPWSNVVGYPDFGFLVTEAGSSTTWAGNSGENRLTPWSNDPVSDPTGEALYLRDEETGEVWTPTPQPAGDGGNYRVRHGAGYTQFEHASLGLRQRLRLFGDPQAPVKIIQLRLENAWDRPRRITATQYVEWVLGTLRSTTQPYLIPEYLHEQAALLVSNPYSAEFGERVAFLSAGKRVHGWTADRLEFIGRGGSLSAPIAMSRIGLEARGVAGDHTCAVLQVHIDLEPGASDEIYFVIGQGSDRAHALELIERFRDGAQVTSAWESTQEFWDHLLDAVQVNTPEPAMDVLLNRWFLYQALSCRIWGRTAFYQSSGAFGFRDQLQDVMAVLPIAPEIARQQILNAARHQFEEGDVLHWWHPPSGRGVRTRITDDLLWLPYVVSEYIQVTGDASILQDEASFRRGPLLAEGEEERYGEFALTGESYTIFEHCRRAIQKGTTSGSHDLPLIGTGDWNDGMNRVGVEGRGESVWLGWFLYDTLLRFAELCEINGTVDEAQGCRQKAAALQKSIEANAWDGDWYLRAFYDSGAPLGSHQNQECQIDSIAQSWAVLSGAGDAGRARLAMEAVSEQLVRPEDQLLLLFTPPFDQTPLDPGYIKGYVPGIRENGGQYTHAATWVVWAFAQLGQGIRAHDLYRLLNPVEHTLDTELADVYKGEPYVIAADVYSVPPHVRRGGWTWYTGSSGWMYRLGVEALLGFRRAGSALVINPAIPSDWEQFNLRYRTGKAVYHIHIRNPQHVERGVVSVQVNGTKQADLRIPLDGYEGDVQVEVTMGVAFPPAVGTA